MAMKTSDNGVTLSTKKCRAKGGLGALDWPQKLKKRAVVIIKVMAQENTSVHQNKDQEDLMSDCKERRRLSQKELQDFKHEWLEEWW